ncbi:MAG: zinc-binding dehydrogenase, partial [Myxococcota bacterium]
GGVGLAAVELGKVMGARVIAAASTDEKLALCTRFGADETINYSTEDLKKRIKALTGGKGADVVYDPVGGPLAEAALRATGWGGRFLVVGFASGDIPRFPLNLVLLKGCQVVGVFWGRFTTTAPQVNIKNNRKLLEWLAAGTLKPNIYARYPLQDAAKALDDIAARRVQGKVVLIP